MGASASAATGGLTTSDISMWSKEEVSEQVAALGKAYEPYKEVVMDNGIDGQTLLGLDDEDDFDLDNIEEVDESVFGGM